MKIKQGPVCDISSYVLQLHSPLYFSSPTQTFESFWLWGEEGLLRTLQPYLPVSTVLPFPLGIHSGLAWLCREAIACLALTDSVAFQRVPSNCAPSMGAYNLYPLSVLTNTCPCRFSLIVAIRLGDNGGFFNWNKGTWSQSGGITRFPAAILYLPLGHRNLRPGRNSVATTVLIRMTLNCFFCGWWILARADWETEKPDNLLLFIKDPLSLLWSRSRKSRKAGRDFVAIQC